MTIADQIKSLDRKIIQMKHNMIQTEKQLKYMHCLLIIWTNMNI